MLRLNLCDLDHPNSDTRYPPPSPHEFPRVFPGVVLTIGCIAVAVYSYFMNVPLSSAYDEKRFLRARIYSNWAIIAGTFF
jgi:hypothetical protein